MQNMHRNHDDSSNYFELTGAKDLFREYQQALSEYTDKPTIRLFFFIVFTLNHLREWITGCGYEEIQRKIEKGSALSEGERFFLSLGETPEFKIINSLCNRGKHFSVKDKHTTSVTTGLHVGGWCTDSLDQTYYMINGIDSREYIYAVGSQYYLWFEKHG